MTLTRGTTFASGDTVTATSLTNLVENLTVSGLTRSNIDQSEGSVHTVDSSEPPGPYAGEVWSDSSASMPYSGVYDGTRFVAGSRDVAKVRAVAAITKGDSLRFVALTGAGTEFSVNLHANANEGNFVGIALEDIASGEDGFIAVNGFVVEVKVTGAVSVGDGLGASSTDGRMESSGARSGYDVFVIARTANVGGEGLVKGWILI